MGGREELSEIFFLIMVIDYIDPWRQTFHGTPRGHQCVFCNVFSAASDPNKSIDAFPSKKQHIVLDS